MRLRGQGAWFRIRVRVRVGNSSQRLGIWRWEWGAGHVFEGAGSLVSDSRGGSELEIHYRG